MDVAAVQFKGDRTDLDGRRRALAQWIWGLGPGRDLVVCPELAVSGYVFRDVEDARTVAESADGPTFQALSPVARALRTWIVCGFVEQARDRLFNSALVLDPAGDLRFTYRKTLLYDADRTWATAGDSGYATFDTAAGDFAVGICMDLNDPEFVSWLRSVRPRALAFPTNWIDEGEDVWPYWAWRMQGNGAALVAANTWGLEGDLQFSGRSAVLQPRDAEGEGANWWVLAEADDEGDAIIRATLK